MSLEIGALNSSDRRNHDCSAEIDGELGRVYSIKRSHIWATLFEADHYADHQGNTGGISRRRFSDSLGESDGASFEDGLQGCDKRLDGSRETEEEAESIDKGGLRMAIDRQVVHEDPEFYKVIVSDNFHYMDPEEQYELTGFSSAEEALAKCRSIVEDWLAYSSQPGLSADKLYQAYMTFGEDPWVVSPVGAPSVKFSAWDYAKENAHKYVR